MMLWSYRFRKLVGGIIVNILIAIFATGFVYGQTLYKIMPLGDSITKGVIIGSTDVTGYRDDLQTLLDTEKTKYNFTYDFVGSLTDGSGFDANHEGHEGFVADSINYYIYSWLNSTPTDIIILHIGTNDVYQGVKSYVTINKIAAILTKIGKSRKILLCSLIPRWDSAALDDSTTSLNNYIKNLYFERLADGYQIHYVGLNEVFKVNSGWKSDYYSNGMHPNTTGYNLMAQVIFNSLMNAINQGTAIVSDNFNRSQLGATWIADPQYQIINDELVNNSSNDRWDYLAIYAGMINANQVSVRWSSNATTTGISKGGILMGLTEPNTSTADGYLVWRYNENLVLYEIRDGNPYNEIDRISGSLAPPKEGEVFKVVLRIEATRHVFDCFINNSLDGTLYDNDKLYGNTDTFYSGIMLKDIYGSGENNNIDEFNIYGQDDVTPPAKVENLAIYDVGTSTVTLKWTAPGDDVNEGTATGYDIRYSSSLITDSNFSQATAVVGEPTPSIAGTQETFIVTGLQPNTPYYFALKTYDEVPNFSLVSNCPNATTSESNAFIDDFNRSELGNNWSADPEFSIENGELANTSTEDNWNFMAVFTARVNPIEVSFKWGTGADNLGIERGGLSIMLDSPSPDATGYLTWCRTQDNKKIIDLWTIDNGEVGIQVASKQIDQLPVTGTNFKVALTTDSQGYHHFIYYLNDVESGEIIDYNPGERGKASQLYAGVMLHGNRNNNIDDFTVVNAGGDPAKLNYIWGNNQTGVVGKVLPDSLKISVTDMNSIPINNVLVNFKVTGGGGHVDRETPDNNIRVEAENATMTGTFAKQSDPTASNGFYAYNNGGEPMEGTLTFNIYVGQADTYIIWGRLRASQGGFSYYSYFVQVDGQPEISTSSNKGVWDFFPQTNAWIWDKVSERGNGSISNPEVDPVTFQLTQGMHTVRITQRFPSVCQIDNILITPLDSGYIPHDKEEVPSYITNKNGIAKAAWRLGTTVGQNNNIVEVTVPGYDLEGEPLQFYASATPDVPQIMVASSATSQTGIGGQQLANPFEVTLTDQYGNVASGYDINFVVTVGNGVLSNGQSSQLVTSNASGKAATNLTLGTESTNNEVQATYPNLSPVIFTATATSGLADKIIKITTENLSGTVNTMLTTPLTVKVVDSGGLAVRNHPVHFKIAEGNGSLSAATGLTDSYKDEKTKLVKRSPKETPIEELATEMDVRTDNSGYAKVKLQLGQTAGNNKVQASALKEGQQLKDSPVDFIAIGHADVPSNLMYVSGNDQTGAAGMALSQPFVVKVIDKYGNGVVGHEVKYKVNQGGGSLTPQGPWYTEAGGQVAVTLILGVVANVTNEVQATAEQNGVPLSDPIIFQATAGAVTALEYVDGNNQSGSASLPLEDSLKVKVLDNYGNPVGGYPVTWTCLDNNQGTVNGQATTIVNSNAKGISKVNFICGLIPGTGYKVEARADGLTGSPIIFTSSVAEIDKLQKISGDGQTSTVGSPLPQVFKVKIVDVIGHAIPNYPVTFKVKQGNGNFDGTPEINIYTNSNCYAEATLTLGPLPGSSNNVVEVSAFRKGLELLSNGTLNEWSGAYPVDWEYWAPENITITQDATNSRSGNCIKISSGATSSFAVIYRKNNITVRENTTYEFSFWAKRVNNTGRVAAGIKDIQGYYLTSDGTWTDQTSDCMNEEVSTVYTKHSIVFTTRGSITELAGDYFRVYGGGSNDIVYIDDISLIEKSAQGDIHLSGSPITFRASALIGEVDSLVAVSGDSQYTVVGNKLEKPLLVQTTDKCGNPISNRPVTFEIKAGGGYLDGNSNLKIVQKTTDGSGKVQVELTIGSTKGEYNNIVEVRSERPGGEQLRNSPYRFYATARSSSADSLKKISGDGQQNCPVRQQLSLPFVAKVTDNKGNGIDSHPVTFTVIAGSGTFDAVSGNTTKTDTTNNDGLVSVYYYPGPKAGELNIVKAQSWNGTPELNGSPVEFTVTPVKGQMSPTVSKIEATGPVAADGQSKSYITVTLTDGYGNPISNKSVDIRVSGSNNSIDQPLTLTDENGRTTGAVASTRAELKTVTAYVRDNQMYLTSSAQVRFTNLPAAYIGSPSGNNQVGNFYTALKEPISALVTDINGNEVYYHPVYFEAYQGGGLIYDLNKQRVYEGTPVYTDSSGRANVYWIMGPSEALNRAKATSTGITGAAEFIAEGRVSTAYKLSKESDKQYSGIAGYTLAEPLVAKVTDNKGDPIYNHAVTFKATFGGGYFNGHTRVTKSTDHFGEASVSFTLGNEAGYNTVEVTSEGLSGSPQVFTAVGNSGEAAKMNKVSGDEITGIVGGTVSGITVVVADIFDNVFKDGYDIIFSILEGNASVNTPIVMTNMDGQASTSITLGTTTGEVIVQAYAAGLINNPLKFKVNAKAADPVDMSIYHGDKQYGTVGRELVYPLDVLVLDKYNNPVSGVSISFVRGGAGTLLTPQEVYTDEDGIASARFQLSSEPITYQVIAIKNGLNGSPLYFYAYGVTNKFPIFDPILDVTNPENQVISFSVKATDEDMDPISYEAYDLPPGATFDALNKKFTWTPNYLQAEEYKVHFIARDSKGGLDDETVNITVTNFNREPQIISYQPIQTSLVGHKDLGETFNFNITVSDQDTDDEITYHWYYNNLLVSTTPNYSLHVTDEMINLGKQIISVIVSDGYATKQRSWEVVIKVPVELVSFSAEVVPREGVYLNWETNFEASTTGFNILRSQSLNGTYIQINKSLISANDTKKYRFNDTDVKVGENYYYKIEDISINGIRTQHEAIKINISKPDKFELSQNYPNPFNPLTKINYQLPDQELITLKIYNLLGQEILTLVDEHKEAGYHTAIWNGLDKYGNKVTSGIYYYRIVAGSFIQSKKMVLIK